MVGKSLKRKRHSLLKNENKGKKNKLRCRDIELKVLYSLKAQNKQRFIINGLITVINIL